MENKQKIEGYKKMIKEGNILSTFLKELYIKNQDKVYLNRLVKDIIKVEINRQKFYKEKIEERKNNEQ